MGSFSEDGECRFFDAPEEVMSIADANGMCNSLEYEAWIQSPRSVNERRSKFMKWMGLSLDRFALENSVDVCSLEQEEDMNIIKDSSRNITGTFDAAEEFCSIRSSISCWSTVNSIDEIGSVENLACNDENLDMKMGLDLDQESQHGSKSDAREVVSDPLVVAEEHEYSENTSGHEEMNGFGQGRKKAKGGWLKKLRSMTCMNNRQGDGTKEGSCAFSGCRIQKVKVRHCRRQRKELSALYMGQDIQAHEGSILTMKFSPDGQYLASAGEDRIVRLWQVVEDERCNEIDIPEVDSSCIYFTVNNLSELAPLFIDKEKISRLKSLKRTSDSACIIFPPKVFRLLEKPLHEFHGHTGEILDLSWSENNYLLSSSVDKTVRLWRVGYDSCIEVFSHSNYVTCVQFNPMDDNYFISGSIDGKVRIWAIPDCHVVDWIDIREIVTAVCYQPDGQGGIIGSITGNCRFYNVSENHLQLDSQLCLIGKKKHPGRGITGFQFLPQDSSKVLVTSSDSKVRILDGLNVIGKYKGIGAGSQLSASFTSDGKHILSACEDSNVYLWNVSQEASSPTKAKKIKSCERFYSNASVAVPWCGLKSQNHDHDHQSDMLGLKSPQIIRLNPPASFSLSQDFYLESFPKGSATWPEEKLPVSSPKPKKSTMHKSEYKFFKSSCKSTSNSHAWGMVIVTADWDGRIKSFHNYGLPAPI
ncbi:WD repeat-containing protein 44 [Senna tora]|uniref:WD repeat-containing protein 44 n=1 Tax=Senna tora TaxID=362788 RepID=A0A834T7T9_9FABA|nr:WD repeat-containing protein 44 [Senna tora]